MKKVICFGSFDPLHKGHEDFFRQAKELGDFLTVVVARDESIKKIKNHEPRVSENERLIAIKENQLVDKVVLGDKDDFGKVLKTEKPDVVCIGYDQKIPEGLKNTLKKYKMVKLKPFESEIYKSSKLMK